MAIRANIIGLLVNRLRKISDKHVLLSKLDDVLILSDKTYPLTVHQYSDCLLSEAINHFHEFGFDTYPHYLPNC